MKQLFRASLLALGCSMICLTWGARAAQGQVPASKIPRTGNHPDFSGVWQALNTANWDLQAHGAEAGHDPGVGAIGAVAPGPGIVEGGEIPYLPAALAQRQQNHKNRWTADPEIKCYMPGVPRANYMPYPFQIIQGTDTIMISYEFADAVRMVYMTDPGKAPADSWMGWSIGHWEGDTLIVDVTSQNDQTWFDRAGDFHSDALHVVERFTPLDANILMYEATIEDPKVFSRPWKISMPLYRHIEKNAQLMEFKCIPFSEDVLYER
ncbi:MAG TPA: hypothetical protein VK686_19580 [Bryobacteraceae bacterium]|jgi:hypothetical protein|nr:hypothetical protein [Bryobacteraceae bacterium]